MADFSAIQNMDAETFQKEIIPGKWTLAQVFDHCLSIEKGVLMYASRKAQTLSELKKGKIKNWVISLILRYKLKSGEKFKAPSVLPPPVNTQSVSDTIEQFKRYRAKMRELILSLPKEHHNKLIFKHPVAGMLTMKQTIHFLQEHWNHHGPQREELLKLLSSNG